MPPISSHHCFVSSESRHQLPALDLVEIAAFGALGSNHCLHCPSLWETVSGTEWEQAIGCQLDHAEDAWGKKISQYAGTVQHLG